MLNCKHFGTCGGCTLLNLPYEEQVQKKRAHLQEILKDFWTDEIPVTITDEPQYFRNKVELGFCHQVKWRADYDKKDPANTDSDKKEGKEEEEAELKEMPEQ